MRQTCTKQLKTQDKRQACALTTMSDFSIMQLQKLHDIACSVARIAGNYMREDQLRRRKVALTTREKLNSVDLVTAADEVVEKIIR